METRSFNITTKVTASKEQWKSLDNLVKSILKINNNNIIGVLISKSSIVNNELVDHFVPIIVTKEQPEDEYYEIDFPSTVEWVLDNSIYFEAITFWSCEE